MEPGAKKLIRALVLAVMIVPTWAQCHPANIASALVQVRSDRLISVRLHFDLLAFVLDATPAEVADPPMNALLDGPKDELSARLEDARRRFERALRLRLGSSEILATDVVFPNADDVLRLSQSMGKLRLPLMISAKASFRVPASASAFAVSYPDVLGSVVSTVEVSGREPVSEPVNAGSTTSPVALPSVVRVLHKNAAIVPPTLAHPPLVSQKPVHSVATTPTTKMAGHATMPRVRTSVQLALLKRPVLLGLGNDGKGRAAAEWREPILSSSVPNNAGGAFSHLGGYIGMGFRHILPEGVDHIFFVLGLFLLSTRWKDLLKQISAFTLAHSLTLGLSLYGVVRLPSSIVEPIIALSIVFVAVENLLTTEMKAWRVYVVFLFGLVHGLGFASTLTDAGLSKGSFLTALIGFNAGVELGQLSVVAAAFLLVGWFRSHRRYRAAVVMPASIAIAAVALLWTVQRVFG